jgi:hypothetical protein
MLLEHADQIVQFIIAGAVIAGLCYALRPQYVFKLSIEGGCVRRIRGTVPRGFVQEAENICRTNAVAGGVIIGLRRGRSIVLQFAGPIDGDCRQRLRNLWQMQGSLR